MSDWQTERIELRDQHAQQLAQQLVRRYDILRRLPERDAAGILLVGYRRRIEIDGVTQREADLLLTHDIGVVMEAMRPLLFPLMNAAANALNEVRAAVVLHLAFALGVETVKDMGTLWSALRAGDFDDAADAMLLSDWPSQVGHSDHERRRAIALVNAMRSGKLHREPR